MRPLDKRFTQLLSSFEAKTGLTGLDFNMQGGSRQPALIIYISNPNDRHFEALEEARGEVADQDGELPVATIRKRARNNALEGPEARLLLKNLAESQNIHRYSFQHDFMRRYTRSVSGAESQIVSNANHVVLGRRGAGKSTLLLYALHNINKDSDKACWIDMQVYNRRDDIGVAVDIFNEILGQIFFDIEPSNEYNNLISSLSKQNIFEPDL